MLRFLQALAKIEKPSANLREGVLASVKAAAEGSALKVSDYQNGFKVGDDETAAVVVQFGEGANSTRPWRCSERSRQATA